MSPINGTTQDRVAFAAKYILAGRNTTRAFDSCFEMGDGDDVVRGLIRRASNNPRLAAALPRYISQHSIEQFSNERKVY